MRTNTMNRAVNLAVVVGMTVIACDPAEACLFHRHRRCHGHAPVARPVASCGAIAGPTAFPTYAYAASQALHAYQAPQPTAPQFFSPCVDGTTTSFDSTKPWKLGTRVAFSVQVPGAAFGAQSTVAITDNRTSPAMTWTVDTPSASGSTLNVFVTPSLKAGETAPSSYPLYAGDITVTIFFTSSRTCNWPYIQLTSPSTSTAIHYTAP